MAHILGYMGMYMYITCSITCIPTRVTSTLSLVCVSESRVHLLSHLRISLLQISLVYNSLSSGSITKEGGPLFTEVASEGGDHCSFQVPLFIIDLKCRVAIYGLC